MIRIAVLGTAFFLVGSSAIAGAAVAPVHAKPPDAHPCRAEAKQFCNDVPYGNGLRLKCLSKHEAQLSSICRTRLKGWLTLFEFGQEQHKKTMAIVAKERADAAKKKPAPASSKPASPAPK
jgi:hypothetical protein